MGAALYSSTAQSFSNAEITPSITFLHKGPCRTVRRRMSCRTSAAQDAMCKDKVNSVKAPVRVEGSSAVSFLGAGGQEITIQCPKVRSQDMRCKSPAGYTHGCT